MVESGEEPIPAFDCGANLPSKQLWAMMTHAVGDWLTKSPSVHTRDAYRRDVAQFLQSLGLDPEALEELVNIRPGDVARLRNAVAGTGQTNSTVLDVGDLSSLVAKRLP